MGLHTGLRCQDYRCPPAAKYTITAEDISEDCLGSLVIEATENIIKYGQIRSRVYSSRNSLDVSRLFQHQVQLSRRVKTYHSLFLTSRQCCSFGAYFGLVTLLELRKVLLEVASPNHL